MGVLDRSAARREVQRHLGRRLEGSLGREHVGVCRAGRRRARHRLSADRRPRHELLRRRSTREQRLRELHRRRRCADRQVPLALPDRPPRHLGHRHAVGRRALRLRAGRTPHAGDRARGEIQLRVRARSRHRQTADPRRGAAGAEGRRADGVVLADAAVSRAPGSAEPRQLQQGHRPRQARGHQPRTRRRRARR